MNREFIPLAWWVKIVTTEPNCLYYFGPFENNLEAQCATKGYVEDLELEGAKSMEVEIKVCQPTHLTICEEELALTATY